MPPPKGQPSIKWRTGSPWCNTDYRRHRYSKRDVYSFVIDESGNHWVSLATGIFRFDPSNKSITKITGDAIAPTENAPAHLANLTGQLGLDRQGNLYVLALNTMEVWKIDQRGILTRVAKGPASCGSAQLSSNIRNDLTQAFSVSEEGGVFLADQTGVRKILNGISMKVLGLSSSDSSPQMQQSAKGPEATSFFFNNIITMATDRTGTIYVWTSDGLFKATPDKTRPVLGCIATVVNGASFKEGSIAPGQLVTVFGHGFGAAHLMQPDLSGGAPMTAAGTRVLFDGRAAPIIYTVGTSECDSSVRCPSRQH